MDDTGRPDLYARERAVRFTPGTVLMYALGTWHRGMPVWEGQARYHHHIGLRRVSRHDIAGIWVAFFSRSERYRCRQADAEWVQYAPIAAQLRSNAELDLDRYLATLSPARRCLLGFPSPASPKWQEEGLLEDCVARYGEGFEAAPYRRAAERPRM